MRISVVLLASLGASASTVGAQALERVAPLTASTTPFTSFSDRPFGALIARERQSLFRFDVLSSTLEHTPGATGRRLEVPLASPPPAAPTVPEGISFDGPRGSEPAPATMGTVSGSDGSAAPVEQAHGPREAKPEPKPEPKPELPLTEVEKPGEVETPLEPARDELDAPQAA